MALFDIRHMTSDDLKSEKRSKRTYTRVLTARSTNPKANNLEVLRDPQLPQENDPDPWDNGCIIVAGQAKRRGKALDLWDISLTSTTETDVGSFDNPLNAPAAWSGRTKPYEVVVTKDVKGNRVVNTAGDYFPDAKKRITGWQFTADVSVADVSLEWIDDFTDCVNENPIVVRHKRCDRGTLMFVDASIGKPQRDNGIIHCPSSFTFEYNPLGWKYRPLNKGFRELIITREKIQGNTVVFYRVDEILDSKGQPISEPAFLNREGKRPRTKLIDGREKIKAPLDPTDIITLEYEVIPYVDFNVMGIFR